MHNNSVAADGQKPLVGWQKLSATAEPSRYTVGSLGKTFRSALCPLIFEEK
jgi:hypothetical protein